MTISEVLKKVRCICTTKLDSVPAGGRATNEKSR